MKTNPFFTTKLSAFTLLGVFALVVTSCGSYQNKSYYDHDGIYGVSQKENSDRFVSQKNNQSNPYKDYFSSLQNNQEQPEIVTDVQNYETTPATVQLNENQEYTSGNSSWGNSAQNVNVYVYDNNWGYHPWYNYWNWNIGWGCNSGFGSYYGYGYNPYVYNPYAYNNWYGNGYYGNGYYGNGYYGGNYAYSNGRRNGVIRDISHSNYHYNGRENNVTNYDGNRNRTNYSAPSTGVRNQNAGIRSNFTTSPSYTSPTRVFNNTTGYVPSPVRVQVAPTRNYSNSNYSNSTYTPTRSQSTPTYSSGNSGGGYNSGGAGGGRSYGGGGGGGGRSSGGGGRR